MIQEGCRLSVPIHPPIDLLRAIGLFYLVYLLNILWPQLYSHPSLFSVRVENIDAFVTYFKEALKYVLFRRGLPGTSYSRSFIDIEGDLPHTKAHFGYRVQKLFFQAYSTARSILSVFEFEGNFNYPSGT
jgi:hypothetical protein